VQPDGKIVYVVSNAGSGELRRVTADGVADASFSNVGYGGISNFPINYILTRVVLQPDGKILVGGLFSTANGFSQNSISRANADGSLDASFNQGGGGASNTVNAIAVLPDGKIAIGGRFNFFNGQIRFKNARLNANGTLDTSYNNSLTTSTVVKQHRRHAIQSLGDGRVLIGGSDSLGVWDDVTRVNADGSTDVTFIMLLISAASSLSFSAARRKSFRWRSVTKSTARRAEFSRG
jgi:uncharacterized delta-60 repeat protein